MNPHDVLQPIGNALRERSERLKVHIPILMIFYWTFTFSSKYEGLVLYMSSLLTLAISKRHES